MQTNQEIMDKIHELLSKSNTDIIIRAGRLLGSGAIDIEYFENNYLLPKALLYVAMRQTAEQWNINNATFKDTVKNLEHF